MKNDPFNPYACQNVATAVASAATLLTQGETIRVVNLSATPAEVVYIQLGNAGAVAAAASSLALLPGHSVYLSREPDPFAPPPGIIGGITHIALLAASGTPAVNVCTGIGGFGGV